jgi:hypothetical protein
LPCGFCAESEIRDFPVCERKVFLRLKRRRRKDAVTGQSIATEQDRYVAHGTRYQKNFAFFLKRAMNTCPVTARSLERFYDLNADIFERQYKNLLSGFRQ